MTVDHGGGVADRIGVVRRFQETEDGLYADMEFANTQLGQETRELIRMGAVTDVSAGVRVDNEKINDQGVTELSGSMDHVAVVVQGAFGEHGSKVLAVHSKEEEAVEEKVEVLEAPDTKSVENLEGQVEILRKQVTELQIPGSKKEIHRPFADMREFLLTFSAANKGDVKARAKMEEFVLADDTTTTAAGLVPDYFSRDIIGIINSGRPYVESIPSDPIGDHGMTIQYPRRTQKPLIDVQATEKTEVASQPTTFDFTTVDLVTYAGASDVSLQLIERSAPSFVTRLFSEYAGVYADKTDGDAVADALANAGASAILADLGADAALTWAAVSTAAEAVYVANRRAADQMVVAVDRFYQLMDLVDSDGRPLLVFGPNGPQNAQGTTGSGFAGTTATYNGLRVIVDPNAAAGTCLVMWSGAAVTIEQTPQQLRALQVSLLGMDMGIWALFAHFVKYPGSIYAITPI
jgi:HK97 family phage major capsid protein